MRELTADERLAVPTVHLNGTSRESLLDVRGAAYDAIQAAYRAVREIAPNGRDYYPAGPVAMAAAEVAHRRRLLALHNLAEEIEAEMCAIDEQGRN
jgi:hypothetical protein